MMRRRIQTAMRQSDDLVIEFQYKDSKGAVTNRVVSPIRFLGGQRFLGLCLNRAEPRQFYLERCENVVIKQAHDYVMPLAMG
jgi:predicted DNA-binding transcriptional regulator YafY